MQHDRVAASDRVMRSLQITSAAESREMQCTSLQHSGAHLDGQLDDPRVRIANVIVQRGQVDRHTHLHVTPSTEISCVAGTRQADACRNEELLQFYSHDQEWFKSEHESKWNSNGTSTVWWTVRNPQKADVGRCQGRR